MDTINKLMLTAMEKYAAEGLADYMFQVGTTTQDGDGELCVFVFGRHWADDGHPERRVVRLVDTITAQF